MRNDTETKRIDIETIVETKQNVNFLLAATVYGANSVPPLNASYITIGNKQCRGTLIGPYSHGGLDPNIVTFAYNIIGLV